MILVKSSTFLPSLFFFKTGSLPPGYRTGKDKLFDDVLDRKKFFLDRKICIFSKGLTHDFDLKFDIIFQVCFSLKQAEI